MCRPLLRVRPCCSRAPSRSGCSRLTDGDQRERLRQAFLADAIEILNRSLDFQETLAALAWIVVPTIADWCAIDTVEDGALRRLAAAHMDPAKIELVKELEDH